MKTKYLAVGLAVFTIGCNSVKRLTGQESAKSQSAPSVLGLWSGGADKPAVDLQQVGPGIGGYFFYDSQQTPLSGTVTGSHLSLRTSTFPNCPNAYAIEADVAGSDLIAHIDGDGDPACQRPALHVVVTMRR